MLMSSLFKTVRQIIDEMPNLSSYLIREKDYWAHRDALGTKKSETLSEHIDLVIANLQNLIDQHQLNPIIDTLISAYCRDLNVEEYDVAQFIKRQFVLCICFHDHGKVNENFQASLDKMANPLFGGQESPDSPLSTNHSALGAYIYLASQFNEIYKQFKGKSQITLLTTAYLFSYPIFKHHSSSLNDAVEDTINLDSLFLSRNKDESIKFMRKYLDCFKFDFKDEVLMLIGNNLAIEKCLSESKKSSAMFGLIKLVFSLLTASDYLATNQYTSGFSVSDLGVFTKDRVNQIYENVSIKKYRVNSPSKINFNAQTYLELDNYKCMNPTEQSGANLNILRKEMGIEVLRNLRANIDANLFYIEAPTGGGKTNLSALAAVELLKTNEGRLNKIFYVFPFITLITQTVASLKDTLGLEDDEIIELHSKASFSEKRENDGLYGRDKLNYISNLFAHYPISLLSHVSFFDILKTNRKDKNYLLHRLANSVVVIDEIQSYNPKDWDKIIYFIRYYAKAFNIKFILMSATLPKLDKLNFFQEEVNDFIYLLPNAREKYFLNPNFCQRITFNFEYFEREDLSLDELAQRLLQESENYASHDYGAAKPLGSVYTIIEFIYKQSATDFYKLLSTSTSFFDEIFVLSGTVLEHRRQYIINYLKDSKNRSRKILLITTQVVEAGVDIDMDLGFKDRSLIDSDEQLAGRINRNVNKKGCKLFLFNFNKERSIYGKDIRLKMTQEHISSEKYKEILETKNFDLLYDLVITNREEWNNTLFAVNFSTYESHIKALRFTKVADEFKLIESKNISCFIPLEVPIKVGETLFFSSKELDFLESYNIYPTVEQKIAGSEIFDLYLDIIKNKLDFTTQKIREKILQSIMSKYIISIFASPEIEDQIKLFSDLEKSEYGYYYVNRWNDFYSEEVGMDTSKLYGIEESQFL